ncbi:hypothetical protein K502DRAFT_327329 [Neoconidiobolus thromboides FSU 785]|nr:hypothetical protein K502DRAFT_327329 [Neoconidiobolus thromboides FSU 785]
MSSEAVEVQKMLEKLEEAVANAPQLEAQNNGDNDSFEINEYGKNSRKSVRYSAEQNLEILRQVKENNPFATKYGDKHQSWNKIAETVAQTLNITLSGKQCREQTHRICNRFRDSQKGHDLLTNQYEFIDPADQLYLDVIDMIGKDKKGSPSKRQPRKVHKIESTGDTFKEDSYSLKRLLPKGDERMNMQQGGNSGSNHAEDYLNLINQASKDQKRSKPALEGVDQQLVLISQTEQLRLQELKQQTELMREMLTFKASIDQRLTALESKVDQFGSLLNAYAQMKTERK